MSLLRILAPALVMPSVIGLACVATGLIRRRPTTSLIGLLALWIAATPATAHLLTRIVERWSERRTVESVPDADAIVVLSAGVRNVPGPKGSLELDDLDRFLGGLDLLRAAKAPLLVFTGGWTPERPEVPTVGSVLADRAISLGANPNAVRTTGLVCNTEEEAEAVKRLLQQDGRPLHVLLVTSAYHMHRATQEFQRAGLVVTPFPVDFQTLPSLPLGLRTWIPSGAGLSGSEAALHELLGWLWCALR